MASYRRERINGDLKRDLNLLINNALNDERLTEVNIDVTGVDATQDLKEAKVYVSIAGSDEEKQEALKALQKAAGYLRTEVSRTLSTYNSPALRFYLDNSAEYGKKIEEILKELKASGQISETLPDEFEEDF